MKWDDLSDEQRASVLNLTGRLSRCHPANKPKHPERIEGYQVDTFGQVVGWTAGGI